MNATYVIKIYYKKNSKQVVKTANTCKEKEQQRVVSFNIIILDYEAKRIVCAGTFLRSIQ